jgi:hypothetical protein
LTNRSTSVGQDVEVFEEVVEDLGDLEGGEVMWSCMACPFRVGVDGRARAGQG